MCCCKPLGVGVWREKETQRGGNLQEGGGPQRDGSWYRVSLSRVWLGLKCGALLPLSSETLGG